MSVVRVVSSLITPIFDGSAQYQRRDTFGFFHFAPRNKYGYLIRYQYQLLIETGKPFSDVRNLTNPHALVLVFTVGCYCAFQSVLQKYKRDLSS